MVVLAIAVLCVFPTFSQESEDRQRDVLEERLAAERLDAERLAAERHSSNAILNSLVPFGVSMLHLMHLPFYLCLSNSPL